MAESNEILKQHSKQIEILSKVNNNNNNNANNIDKFEKIQKHLQE